VKAKPGVDPWLPGEGTTITLPRQYVIPEARREGIVINLAEYRLYYFTGDGVQVYPVGVGTSENPSPLTDAKVTMPLESPAWYPPASIRAEYEASGDFLPRMIPPGPGNPLGSHALLLSEQGYPHEDYSQQDRDRLWHEVTLEVEAFRQKHPGVEVQRRAIELAVDQADGIPAMVGEQVARLASDKTSKDKQPVTTEEPEQKLYF
jgi:hypothetical protein